MMERKHQNVHFSLFLQPVNWQKYLRISMQTIVQLNCNMIIGLNSFLLLLLSYEDVQSLSMYRVSREKRLCNLS